DRENPEEDGLGSRPRRGPLRTERSVRRPGARGDPGNPPESRKGKRKRRGGSDRASHRRLGHAHSGDAALRTRAAQPASGNRRAVPGRRQRRGPGGGTLSESPAGRVSPRRGMGKPSRSGTRQVAPKATLWRKV